MDTLCRLMSPDLPLTIEPKCLARKGETIAGQYVIQDMQRLGELLQDRAGVAIFVLQFTHDAIQQQFFIRGNITANVSLQCQRCLGTINLGINSQVYLGIADNTAESLKLPASCEPLILGAEPIPLLNLIEDELILALPIAAMHEADECNATALIKVINDKTKTSPFHELKKLKQK